MSFVTYYILEIFEGNLNKKNRYNNEKINNMHKTLKYEIKEYCNKDKIINNEKNYCEKYCKYLEKMYEESMKYK